MLRFLCRETDIGAAANVGGPVNVLHRTFTDANEAEGWLRFLDYLEEVRAEYGKWKTREVIGVELVAAPDPDAGEGVGR